MLFSFEAARSEAAASAAWPEGVEFALSFGAPFLLVAVVAVLLLVLELLLALLGPVVDCGEFLSSASACPTLDVFEFALIAEDRLRTVVP
jgi:hypothetical protein